MDQDIDSQINKLLEGIASHPDLHTKLFRRGVRIYDRPYLVDGTQWYVRVTFDWHPATKRVTILTVEKMEASGPH